MTKICHISDTHGKFPKLNGNFDIILHTGDFFPKSVYRQAGNFDKEKEFEIYWLYENLNIIKKWLTKPFLFVLGNHDFVPPSFFQNILNEANIEAYNLHDKIFSYHDYNFYGFPYVNYINGNFKYELNQFEMFDKVKEFEFLANQAYIDVIAAHSPVYNILDSGFGNVHMANALFYGIHRDLKPKLYACGHIHESHGILTYKDIIYSNAATIQNIIEI